MRLIISTLFFFFSALAFSQTHLGTVSLKTASVEIDLEKCLQVYKVTGGNGRCSVPNHFQVNRFADFFEAKSTCTKVVTRDLTSYNSNNWKVMGRFMVCANVNEYFISVDGVYYSTNVSLSPRFLPLLKDAIRESLEGKTAIPIFYLDIH